MRCFFYFHCLMRKLAFLYCFVVVLSSCQKEPSESNSGPLAAQTHLNVAYGSDAAHKLDIYLPAGRTDTTKLIILVHGGAWIEGDKSDFNPFVTELQQRLPGYAIANINYRLATQTANHFPAQENDMKAAVDFLAGKTAEYKISQKFVLLGASAGGHMALLQAYKYSSPKIRAVVDFFGPSDMAMLYNNTDPANQFIFSILMGGTPTSNPTIYQQSSPINFVNAQSPPTIILHGEEDDLVPVAQSTALAARLQTSGVTHQTVIYPGMGHEIWPAATMNDAFNKIQVFLKANVQ
jgi:acetyl esterase/lipase